MRLQDIMARPVQTIQASAPTQQAVDIMAEQNVGALLVYEGEELVGIITDRDVLVRCLAGGPPRTSEEVRNFMTAQPIVAAAPHDRLELAALILGENRVRRLPVVEDGRVIGIVTADDIARHLSDPVAVAQMWHRLAYEPTRESSAA
jgi:CBS domain-containing protein